MLVMDHLLELQEEQEEAKGEDAEVDTELMYTHAFFMGMAAGVILEKSGKESALAVSKKAEKFMKQVPKVMQTCGDYAKVNEIMSQIEGELGASEQNGQPDMSIGISMVKLDQSELG